MRGSYGWGVAILTISLAACGDGPAPPPEQDHTRATSPRVQASESERPQWEKYLAEVKKAEALDDPLKTCLAYPDLPGQQWPAGAAKARCLILRESELTLERIAAVLDAPDGGQQLDAFYAASLQAHYQGGDHADQLFIDFEMWDDSEEASTLSERWLRVVPESGYAQTARGLVRLKEAVSARGSDVIDETSPEQLRGMAGGMRRALPLLERALAAQPRLSPACDGQFKIGQYMSDAALREQARATCRRIDPGSFYVISDWLFQAEPKWGGTRAELDAVVTHIRAQQAAHPALASLVGDMKQADALFALWGNAQLEPYSALLATIPAQRPQPNLIGYAAKDAYFNKSDYLTAAGYASQALRFMPKQVYWRKLRAAAYDRIGRYDDAMRDGRRLIALGKADAFLYQSIGHSALKLGQNDLAREWLGNALVGAPDPHWTYHNWCQLQITPQLFADKALSCTKELVEKYPNDPRSFFMRAWVLMDVGDPRAEAMADRFFAAADPKDPTQASFIQQLRQRMGKPAQ